MRLIDADALMERFAEMQKMGKTDGTEYACNFMSAGQEPSAEWYTIEDAVDNAPTVDAVPVCRCEKCVYWDAGTRRHNSNDVAEWDEAICDKYHEFGLSCDVWTATDDFCSYGERKGGDE